MEQQKPVLEVINLTKLYKNRNKLAINNLNFKVYPGEFHAFIGDNGAGKTTTIKSIIGSYSNYSGTIFINGIDNRDIESKQKLGYIPEIARFPVRINAFDYVYNLAVLNGIDPNKAKTTINNLFDKFNINDLKDKSPNTFSSGQKKKILLIHALTNDPTIIIMDEPTANLDPRTRLDFFNVIKELQATQNTAVLISSHDLSELETYCDALTIIETGNIVYTGKKSGALNMSQDGWIIHIDEKYLESTFDKYQVIHNTIDLKTQDQKELNRLVNKLSKANILKSVSSKKYLTIEEIYRKYVLKG